MFLQEGGYECFKVFYDLGKSYCVTIGGSWVLFGTYEKDKKFCGVDSESGDITKKLAHFVKKFSGRNLLVEGLIIAYPNITRVLGLGASDLVVLLVLEKSLVLERLRERTKNFRIRALSDKYSSIRSLYQFCLRTGLNCLWITEEMPSAKLYDLICAELLALSQGRKRLDK
jgi:hypothetical protein